MATSSEQQATQLRFDQSQARRQQPAGSGNPNLLPNLDQPFSTSNTTAAQEKRSPSFQSSALRLSKSLARGSRDKSRSFVDQAAGEAAARGGQLAGGFVGSYVPIVGTTVGAAIGKRVGRVAGENWKTTLVIGVITLFFLVLFNLMIFFPLFTVVLCSSFNTKTLDFIGNCLL